jgi:hypothetical protein
VTAGSPSTIDFGLFNGTFNAIDILDASVWSDANSPNSWVLYVTTSPGTNPSNMLSTLVDTAHSSSAAGFTVNTGAMTLVSTTTPGLQLATYNGGVVDFGNQVVQGYSYLYKYAAQAAVTTNDLSGFTLYAEGASDIQDLTAGGTIPLNQTLYWLPSSASNSPISAATGFHATTSPVGCGGTCINYPANPPANASVWNYPSSTIGQPGNKVSQGFDYELRLYSSPNPDSYSVYIVYTAVGN